MNRTSEQAHTLIVELAREVAVADALATALRNIAGGHWNVGRLPNEDMTAREYARETLRSAGLPEDWS